MAKYGFRNPILLSGVLMLVIFGLDLITPRGVAESILYVVAVTVSLLSQNRRPILVVIILSVFLTILGLFVSPENPELWKSVLNRFFAIVAVLLVGILGLVRLKMEGYLKESQQVYINALDQLLEGAQIIGFDWRYIYINDSVAKQGRQTKEGLLGRTMMDVYTGIEQTDLFAVLSRCMRERLPHLMENEFTYPDGSKGWFELSIQPVKEGLFILSNDITKRKRVEKELRQINIELEHRVAERTFHLNTANENLSHSETRYRALFEQSNDAVFLLDFQGRHIVANQRAADMLGYSVDEIQGLSARELSAEPEKSEQVLNRLLAGERIPFFERLFRKKSGQVIPVEINVELVRDDSGNPIHIQSVVRDISKRKQDEDSTRRQSKMFSDLHKITLDLLQQKDLQLLLNRIVELSTGFLDADYSELMLVEGETLVVKSVTENQKQLLGERAGRQDATLSWQAFDTRKPVILTDYSKYPRRRKIYSKFELRAVADFPILNNEECIGVLAFGRIQPNYEFSKDQIQFGELFASLTALVLNNARLREELREQSIRDPLTGLFNRRYMDEMLAREVSRANRHLNPLGVIMIDIDHFKRFNDSYGHAVGDRLLKDVGSFLKERVRGEDIACRYGGEEFLLVMPNANLEVVQQRAELLCREGKNIQTMGYTVTFSLGVAVYPQHGQSIPDVLKAVDAALYLAKQNGRNQVVIAV